MTLQDTLKDRGSTHGDFTDNASVSQGLKSIIHNFDGKLNDIQREALDMICHKIARICAGDGNYKDHWHDLAGYATLVEERL